MTIDTSIVAADTQEKPKRKFYFINEQVEWQLTRYIWTGCTKIEYRDKIMSNATELIRQIIRKQGLHVIYPGQEESAFGDLLQTAWVQIEKTLYKYRARPHCRVCYNPDHPAKSLLYYPGDREYGIKSIDEVLKLSNRVCPHCSAQLADKPIIEPLQDLYGGSETILYRGMSKVFNMWCLAPSTQLITSSGIISIDDAINDNASLVYGMEGPRPINGTMQKDSQDTLVFTTELGYKIECSPVHKLYCLRRESPVWTCAKDINIDDLVGMQYDSNYHVDNDYIGDIIIDNSGEWSPPDIITEELAYIIGLYLAEGSWSYGKFLIYNTADEIINKLVNNTLGLNFIYEPKYGRISLCDIRFIEFMEKLGFNHIKSAQDKYISQRILQMSEHIIRSVLAGMFDGAGHSTRHNGVVGYTSSSEMLINQVRMILLNLGILTKIQHGNRETSCFGGEIREHNPDGSWQLILSTHNSQIFYDTIGFTVAYKQKNSEVLKNSKERVYGLQCKVKSLYAKYGSGKLSYDSIRTLLVDRRFYILGAIVNKIIAWENYSDDADYQYIVSRLDERFRRSNKIIWLPIRCITQSKSRLCEISVDSNDHSYIANGFITHNSQVARTVILAYIKKEGRDRKNSQSYAAHLSNKPRQVSDVMIRFLAEARQICQYNEDHIKIISALEWLIHNDSRPHDGIIGKLVERTGLSRVIITGFIRLIKLRSFDFTDSPINRNIGEPVDRRRIAIDFDEE